MNAASADRASRPCPTRPERPIHPSRLPSRGGSSTTNLTPVVSPSYARRRLELSQAMHAPARDASLALILVTYTAAASGSGPCVRCRAALPSHPAAETYRARHVPSRSYSLQRGVVSEPGCTPHVLSWRLELLPRGPPKDGKRCSERGARQRPRLPQPGRTSDQATDATACLPGRSALAVSTPPPSMDGGWTQGGSRFRGASLSVAVQRLSATWAGVGGTTRPPAEGPVGPARTSHEACMFAPGCLLASPSPALAPARLLVACGVGVRRPGLVQVLVRAARGPHHPPRAGRPDPPVGPLFVVGATQGCQGKRKGRRGGTGRASPASRGALVGPEPLSP